MTTLRNLVAMLVMACGVLLSGDSVCCGEVYRDASRHFSLQLPPAWEELPASFVNNLNDAVRRSVSNVEVRYERGFGPQGKVPGSFPYALVQILQIPEMGVSYEEVEKIMGAAKDEVGDIKGPIGDLLSDISVGKPVLERAKNRTIVHMSSELQGVGKVHCLSVGQLGKGQIVLLHSYAPEAEFANHLPTLTAMYDSFQFDPEFKFVASKKRSLVMDTARIGALVGAIAGGLGGLFWALYSKHRSKSS